MSEIKITIRRALNLKCSLERRGNNEQNLFDLCQRVWEESLGKAMLKIRIEDEEDQGPEKNQSCN